MTVAIVGNLGGALRQGGHLAESGPYYRRAYESMLARYGADDRRTLMLGGNLGNFLWQSGDFAGAEILQRAALDGLGRKSGEVHPSIAENSFALGRTLCSAGRADEGRPLLQRAVRIRKQLLPADSPEITEVQALLDSGCK